MRFSDALYFNSLEYTNKLEALVASQRINEIREREVLKNRQIYGYWTKVGMGALLFVPTMGLSSVTSGIGFRQLWVACSKLDVINNIIKKYGITPYQCQFRDRAIPIVISVLTAGIGFGTSCALSDISGMGVEGGSAQGLSFGPPTSVEGVIDSATTNPSGFVDGAFHGVGAQIEAVSAALSPGDTADNVTQATVENAVPASMGSEYYEGANAGYATAAIVERFLVQHAVASSLEHIADQSAREELYRRVAQEDDAILSPTKEMYDWERELGEVHDALNEQYAGMITEHSRMLHQNKTKPRDVVAKSMAMREMVVSLESRAREERLNSEQCRQFRFVSSWVSCLKTWEDTLKEQASAQAEWDVIIQQWKRA